MIDNGLTSVQHFTLTRVSGMKYTLLLPESYKFFTGMSGKSQ
jgi:hypothetical protein